MDWVDVTEAKKYQDEMTEGDKARILCQKNAGIRLAAVLAISGKMK
ncbi:MULTISPECIES: hypothetical protein [Bacillus cereus group]|nr:MULTISPECIES: hypothetical protein [Bacillus cereus group]